MAFLNSYKDTADELACQFFVDNSPEQLVQLFVHLGEFNNLTYFFLARASNFLFYSIKHFSPVSTH